LKLERPMAQRKAHQIWIEQCEAVQSIKTPFGLKAAFGAGKNALWRFHDSGLKTSPQNSE